MPFFMIFVVVASVAIFWLFKVVATAGALIAAVPFSFVLLRFGSVSVHPPALEDADTYDAVETTKIVGNPFKPKQTIPTDRVVAALRQLKATLFPELEIEQFLANEEEVDADSLDMSKAA